MSVVNLATGGGQIGKISEHPKKGPARKNDGIFGGSMKNVDLLKYYIKLIF